MLPKCPLNLAVLLLISFNCLSTRSHLLAFDSSEGVKEAQLAQILHHIGVFKKSEFLIIFNPTNSSHFINMHTFMQHLFRTYFHKTVKVFHCNSSTSFPFKNYINTRTLGLVFINSTADSKVQELSEILRHRKAMPLIFLINHVNGHGDIRNLSKTLWQKRYSHVVFISRELHIFTLKVVPVARLVNVTQASVGQYFPNFKDLNFRGYKVKVPVFEDIPHLFTVTNAKGKLDIHGLGGMFFRTLFKRLNISYDLVPMPRNVTKLKEMLVRREIELIPTIFTSFEASEDYDLSYPLRLGERCLIIPYNDAEEKQTRVWHSSFHCCVFLFLILIYIGCRLFMVLRARLGFQTPKNNPHLQRTLQPVSFFLFNFRFILFIPVESLKMFEFQGPQSFFKYLRAVIIFLTLSLTGFQLSQFFATEMISIITVTLFKKPTITVGQILQNGPPILVDPSENSSYYYNTSLGRQLRPRYYVSPVPNINLLNLQNLNSSFIYPVMALEWAFINRQQQNLQRKKFWLSRICYPDFIYHYILQADSYLVRPLQRIHLRSLQFGANIYRFRETFRDSEKLKFLQSFKPKHDPQRPGDLAMFTAPLKLYLLWISISCGVFGLELAYHQALRKYQARRHREKPTNHANTKIKSKMFEPGFLE